MFKYVYIYIVCVCACACLFHIKKHGQGEKNGNDSFSFSAAGGQSGSPICHNGLDRKVLKSTQRIGFVGKLQTGYHPIFHETRKVLSGFDFSNKTNPLMLTCFEYIILYQTL